MQCILDLLSNHLASQIRFFFQSLKLRLRIILARCLHYICEYVKMAYTRCLLRKCVGPIFSLLPVSNHVQVRRVAGGQIIPVRAGFVQDTQLPLFSPIHCAAPVCSAGPTTGGLLSWAGFTSPCQNIGCPPPSLLPRPPNECFQQRCTTISQLPRGTIALTAPKRYNSVSRT